MITRQDKNKACTNDNQHLFQMGWTSHFEAQLGNVRKEEFVPARVVGSDEK